MRISQGWSGLDDCGLYSKYRTPYQSCSVTRDS